MILTDERFMFLNDPGDCMILNDFCKIYQINDNTCMQCIFAFNFMAIESENENDKNAFKTDTKD